MSLEYDFLQELNGNDPDGFVYSVDRRGLVQRIKEFVSSFKEQTSNFRDLPYDIFSEEENEEH